MTQNMSQGKLRDITSSTQDAQVIDDSASSTDEIGGMEMDEDLEEIIRDEARNWLAEYGAKFFSIETAKFLSIEAKRKNVRSIR